MKEYTCCFFGHRKIKITDGQRKMLYSTIEKLIIEENVYIFLFGSKSKFDDLCYEVVSELKEIYPFIRRIYVRAQLPYIDNDYKCYLLQSYEDTYFPEHMINAGKSAYVERNYDMINKSKFCVAYFDENYTPYVQNKKSVVLSSCVKKSGARIAYDYAIKKQKTIINIFGI